MRTLYLLRHAKSSWSEPSLPDRERPLAPRGRRAAKRIAAHLARLEIEPALVLCSSATRARETLELVRPAFVEAPVQIEEELYAASADRLLERLRAVSDTVASVMLIGHNPGLHDLALTLASTGAELERLSAKLPTAALVTLALPEATWSGLAEGDAELAAFVVPRQLD
jgi:phosphohistidine phosphatase